MSVLETHNLNEKFKSTSSGVTCSGVTIIYSDVLDNNEQTILKLIEKVLSVDTYTISQASFFHINLTKHHFFTLISPSERAN